MSMYADDVTLAYLKQLEEENSALLVAIEAKDAMLKRIASGVQSNGCLTTIYYCISTADEGIDIPASTELLEARDRKRDIKLLYAVVGILDNVDGYVSDAMDAVEKLIAKCESGEWIPEL